MTSMSSSTDAQSDAGYQRTGLICGACRHAWFQQTPTNVPLAAWAGFVKALRCPACGGDELRFGGTPDAQDASAGDQPNDSNMLRYTAWLKVGDTGQSSDVIARTMAGLPLRDRATPEDAQDLGRCLRLLRRFPAWQARMAEVAAVSPGWAALVAVWPALLATMEDEVGIDWNKGVHAVRTNDRLRAALGNKA